jgi:GMP synthase PP-ATPase subunit
VNEEMEEKKKIKNYNKINRNSINIVRVHVSSKHKFIKVVESLPEFETNKRLATDIFIELIKQEHSKVFNK